MAATWTDEGLAATIWVVFTFVPWIIIEGWVRWQRLLDHIAVAGAALVLLADEGTLADLLATESADGRGNPGVRADSARAPVARNPGM